MKIFPIRITTALPLSDVRAPIRISTSRILRGAAMGVQFAGLATALLLLTLIELDAQYKIIAAVILCGIWAVNALNTGLYNGYRATDIIAFGLHSVEQPDVAANALDGAPGTVAAVAKKEALEIIAQTRDGKILRGQLAVTQFVAPFFTCIRFTVLDNAGELSWFLKLMANKKHTLVLLPDNIAADEFRQVRVLLRWT